jgi:hypothetical protein
MRRLIIRLIVIGVFGGGSWIAYQLADVTKCNGPKAEQWAGAALERVKGSNADMESVTEYTTRSQFDALASRAKGRYTDQQGASAPACLSDFQRITSEALYYEWKAYDAAASRDFDLASTDIDKAQAAREAMEREYYSLAAKYKWNTTK